MKSYNNIIMPMFIMSIIMSLSSHSWIIIWMGMEMNLLSFIFFMMMKMNMSSNESSMKYFLIQSSGSIIFLFSISLNIIYFNQEFHVSSLAPPIALALKSGMAPLHSWTPDIISKFNYFSLFLFLTLQKIVPTMIMFSSWYNFSMWILIMNIMVGSIAGIPQASLTKLMIFSSINNIGWMFLAIMVSMYLFMIFFISYTVMTMLMIWFMKYMQMKWLLQMKSMLLSQKMTVFFMMASLSGLPPLLGFMPKWVILKNTAMVVPLFSFLAIGFSLFTLYFYIKSSFSMLLLSHSEKKWNLSIPTPLNSLFLTLNFIGPIVWITMT
uniref:NADH-ubiquinone oxidoreductase chain 2 n=1 Tax=Livia junci TaxID=1449964 RepID=A0A344A2I3_9HEMI|nr:NADH dehydrogenase subunit 2 [Livia junci]AWU48974.1 NADH dehydrogenase subunit 2 [Livia junci]